MNRPPIPEILPDEVKVVSSLLVDPMGRVRDGVSSNSLSSPEDRQRFLALRAWGNCIVIGRKTWESESYAKCKLPVIVYSRSTQPIMGWSLELKRLQGLYGPRIIVEAGPDLLEQLLQEELIDRLYLTKTTRRSLDEESPRFDFRILKTGEVMDLIERTTGREDLFEVYQRKSLGKG